MKQTTLEERLNKKFYNTTNYQRIDGESYINVPWFELLDFIKSEIQLEREKVINKVKGNVDSWCAEYMALGNHNLEYNKPTPPIWTFLKKKLENLKSKYKL